MFRATLTLAAIILGGAAQADTGPPLPEDWQGLFTTETVAGCSIVKSGDVVREAHYGYGNIGNETKFGMLNAAAGNNALLNIEETLAYEVGKAGYNGVVGVRYEINHTADAVYESGKNWRNGDNETFDFAGTFITLIYGTPVRLKCE